jgi:transcriptional regulator with XRE-family HTH domain
LASDTPTVRNVEPTEQGLRIRAARTYGRFKGRQDFAAAIESSPSTVQRIEEGSRHPKRAELLAIAEVCRVPMWFLVGGWDGWRSLDQSEEVDIEAREALKDIHRTEDRVKRSRRSGGRESA